MWGVMKRDATRTRPAASGVLPGLERAPFPNAFVLLTGGALQPGLLAAADVARQEIAAGLAVLGIGRGDGSHGAARPGARGLPGGAGVLSAAAEPLGGGGARIGEVPVRWQFGHRLGAGRRRDRTGMFRFVGAAPERVELVGDATPAGGPAPAHPPPQPQRQNAP